MNTAERTNPIKPISYRPSPRLNASTVPIGEQQVFVGIYNRKVRKTLGVGEVISLRRHEDTKGLHRPRPSSPIKCITLARICKEWYLAFEFRLEDSDRPKVVMAG